MAPITLDTTQSSNGTNSSPSHFLWLQDVPPEMMIVAVVAISVVSALIFAGIGYLIIRTCRRTRRPEDLEFQIEPIGQMKERRESGWLRKNSEALWSVYIGEDDLKSTFAKPSSSRMFSIGSVSTLDNGRCPLDRRPSPLPRVPFIRTDTATSKDALLGSDREDSSLDQGFCRPAWWDRELDNFPTEDEVPRPRAASQPQPYTDKTSFDDLKARKQSLPVWQLFAGK